MKFCTKCGKELFDEAEICTGCGCSTRTPAQSVVEKEKVKSERKKKECKSEGNNDSKTIICFNFIFSIFFIFTAFFLFLSIANAWVDLEYYNNSNASYTLKAFFNLDSACSAASLLFALVTFAFSIITFIVSLVIKPRCKEVLSALTKVISAVFLFITSFAFIVA